ncbi:MAG: putative basic amino acid antiporter YfcC [Verrucomicrobiota bacterium]|nr:putative basic amino acid antiporter YfcC [Verrucomicrobiota bacterium]
MSTATPSPSPSVSRWEMPDSYILIFLIIVLAAVSTWFIPAGTFQTEQKTIVSDGQTIRRTVIMPGSYRVATHEDGSTLYLTASLFSGEAGDGTRHHVLPASAEGRTGLLNYAFDGMTSGTRYGAAIGVVVFILIIGGAFGIILRTGAVEAGILKLIATYKGSDQWIIPLLFIIFSLGGAVLGMGEEAIAFAILLLPLFLAMGYDSITVVLVTYVATQVGFASSWMNPFNVSIAQGLADIPILSGVGFRFCMWCTFTLVTLACVIWYTRQIKKNPRKSPAYDIDLETRAFKTDATGIKHSFSTGHAVVLLLLLAGLAWITQGVIVYHYFIPEIATQFFAIGLAIGIAGVLMKLNGMRWNDLATSFRHGAADLLGAAMIVGMAKGIVIMLGGDNPAVPSVLNTILQWAGGIIEPFSGYASACGMLLFQSGLNFFVPSGSGQAALTMPIMAPLADIAGIERQVAVLAFQLGDGLTNLVIPTSAALMGTLAVVRLDFITWLRFMFRLQIVLAVLSFFFVLLAVAIGLT